MTNQVNEILEAVRRLSPSEQTEFSERLWSILDPDPSIEEEWAAEAERRLAAYERGELEAIDAKSVMAKYRRR